MVRSVYGILLKSEEEMKWHFLLPSLLFNSIGFIILDTICVLSHPYKCDWSKNHLEDKGRQAAIASATVAPCGDQQDRPYLVMACFCQSSRPQQHIFLSSVLAAPWLIGAFRAMPIVIVTRIINMVESEVYKILIDKIPLCSFGAVLDLTL
ncbi:hypothetical protein STEG23_024537 [Scotinomys teguina]